MCAPRTLLRQIQLHLLLLQGFQNGVKKWLRAAANRSEFEMSASLRGFLYTPDSAAFNSGIIGGALPQFERFRAALERRTHIHYASVERRRGHASRFVVDMLVQWMLFPLTDVEM